MSIIRQVVEAAVSQALAGLELAQESHTEDEVDTILSVLDTNLVMD